MTIIRFFSSFFILVFLGSFSLPFVAKATSCICYDKQGSCTEIFTANDETTCDANCSQQLVRNYANSEYITNDPEKEEEFSNQCIQANLSTKTDTATSTEDKKTDFITPILGINIPTISFSKIALKNQYLEVNFIGEYISGLYKFLIGVAMLVTVILIMVAGVQYVTSSGGGNVGEAKKRLTNAVTGFVLLMFVTIILYTINPALVFFQPLKIKYVQEVELDKDADGEEGSGVSSNSLKDLKKQCLDVVKQAQSQGTCNMTQGQKFGSPTGKGPNCGRHHWEDSGANWQFQNIKNLDYAAVWGEEIKAPFDGIVSYQKQKDTNNRCGNRIYLKGSGAEITICHAKDFTNTSGTYITSGTSVKKGDTIGHLGGNCCAGQSPPGDWSTAKGGWCNKTGTMCTDPEKNESCSCQPIEQAGNTSGPHVHVSWNPVGGNLLACLEE
ncbi:MAG: hypothetical protein UU48_C0002G0066 [Candidatus Uhrbacteria bacterium GW2011_GWF2_41_16]|uniref:M23ase beta-sheet core domain-containing protein n=2 Tax=Candidatus Uhriibacteriota TaxID=1752732 RepID=A0A0G0VFV4_9BACT|nr:MAG: hypothetical protein UU31_C0003G0074 [Candidatus Uhrbacteria bacterium GW2011_GWA2_41_10]KKR87551.1 MAG: hypothetical protein UU35_C0002G0052 [Candidatus Uhrbacteria bacterium GW2011_GWC2_41_11]KKR98531.1 MAG: hypothetical protein UU48_C0002G0066 [Candidatus Uhrbacteria bacterium GW2011_GWF2_41_16]HBO99932.1 hypothetical protein [Candidatus Uhrbacteria bacterium]